MAGAGTAPPTAGPDRGFEIRVAALVCVAGVLLAVIVTALGPPSLRGDTAGVVRGAKQIVKCTTHGRFVDCDEYLRRHATQVREPMVGPFPLFQYGPSVVLRAFGASLEATIRVLVAINALSLLLLLGLARYALRRAAPALWTPLVTLAVVASPLLWYGRVGFGEELAAAVVLAAVVLALGDTRPVLLGVLVAAACITKETNPPFVVAIVLVCLLAHHDRRDRAVRPFLVATAVGAVVGMLMNTAFNVFRFGSVRNTNYMRSALYAPNIKVASHLFVGQWFAPNGGMLWFWPLAFVLVFAVAVLAARRRQYAPALLAAVLVAQVALLSTWWSPFGWLAWGPRLVIPLVPAILVASCVLGAADATPAVARFLSSAWIVPAGVVLAVLGLPQAVTLFHGGVVGQFFTPPLCANADILNHQARYYTCWDRTAWTKQPWMLQLGMHGFGTIAGKLVAIAFVGAVVLLLIEARRAARVFLTPRAEAQQVTVR